MQQVSLPYFDPEYDNLTQMTHGPRVCIDNESKEEYTVVKVDCANRQGILLDLVQVLTDLNLGIHKCYISSDAGWFMDVFYVKDENGNKITDSRIIKYIQKAIRSTKVAPNCGNAKAYACNLYDECSSEHTAIEMTGIDRPGLFSEISAALVDLHCNIVEAHAWSHNARAACVAYVSDEDTASPIDDPHRLATIEEHLNSILRATPDISPSEAHAIQQEMKTSHLHGGEGTVTSVERRLHQLLLSVRDFDGPPWSCSPNTLSLTSTSSGSGKDTVNEGIEANVTIGKFLEKGYTVVSIECKDRPRLIFDTICTITDMQYAIFHASTSCNEGNVFQEYFVRHMDGHPMKSEGEKDRVIKCLKAAIERRVCEGVRLELCAENRIGLVSDITRVLRENGLSLARADVATEGNKAMNAFYVRDISGRKEVDTSVMESVKRAMGQAELHVKSQRNESPATAERFPRFSIKSLLGQFERFTSSQVKTCE